MIAISYRNTGNNINVDLMWHLNDMEINNETILSIRVAHIKLNNGPY